MRSLGVWSCLPSSLRTWFGSPGFMWWKNQFPTSCPLTSIHALWHSYRPPPPISHQANVIEAENNRKKWTFYTLTLPETRMRANLSSRFPLLQAVCPENARPCVHSPQATLGLEMQIWPERLRWCVNFLLHFQPTSLSFLWIGKSGSLSVFGVCV